jgi:hypothetical protein
MLLVCVSRTMPRILLARPRDSAAHRRASQSLAARGPVNHDVPHHGRVTPALTLHIEQAHQPAGVCVFCDQIQPVAFLAAGC